MFQALFFVLFFFFFLFHRNQFTHKRRKRRRKLSDDEPLWQSARKHTTGSALTRMFVFSTDLANRAAESVERGEFDSIVQFHQAQPKGPGFFRSAHELHQGGCDRSPGDDSYDIARPRSVIQRHSPASTTQRKSAASSPGMEVGGGGSGEDRGDAHVSPASLPSRPLSRQSRQLKKQSSWAGSTGHSPPLGDTLEGVGRVRKASPSPYVDPKSPSDSQEVWEQWGNHGNQRKEHQSGSKCLGEQGEDKDGRGEEGWSRLQGKKGNGDGVDRTQHVAVTRPPQRDQSEASHRAPNSNRLEVETTSPAVPSPATQGATAMDETNYTICHGTPRTAMQGDISSPVPTTTRGVQQPSSSEAASFSPHVHPSLPHGGQQHMEIPEPFSGSELGIWAPSNHYPLPSGGYHHHHHHQQQLPGLSYSAHPVSAMQAGYPYPVSYPWGPLPPMHHAMGHHQLRSEDVMHPQQQQQQQALGSHVSYMHPPPTAMMEESGSSVKEGPGAMFLPNPPPLTSDALPPSAMTQASRPPPPAHHSTPHGHHMQPGVVPQRHYQAIPPDYFGHPSAHHIFPYGFEGAGLQQMHLWPPQSHGGQLPPPGMHPAHMMPGQGGWYPQLVHSMVSGVEVHSGGGGGGGDSGKVAGKKSSKHEVMQVVDVKLNSNGNNNNNILSSSNKQAALRNSSDMQRVVSDGDRRPLAVMNPGTSSLPLEHRWTCSKDSSPVVVTLPHLWKGEAEPFSVKAIAIGESNVNSLN